MVRCSRIAIVQLLVLFTVIGLLSNYISSTQDSVNSNNSNEEVSYRQKFQKIELEMASEHDLSAVAVTQSVRAVSVTEYTSPVYSTSSSEGKGRTTSTSGAEGVEEGEIGIEREQREQSELQLTELEQSEQEQSEQEQIDEQEQEQKQEQETVTPPDERESAEQRILQRMERIKTACARLGNPNSSRYNMYHFSGLGPHGFTWCPTFKASSSTWRDFFIDKVMGPGANFHGTHYHLAVLSNNMLSRGKQRGSSQNRRRAFVGESGESIRFTVVRHPMSRLISHLHKAQNYPYEVRAQQNMWVEESISNGRSDPTWDAATRQKYKDEWNVYLSEIEKETEHRTFSESNPYLHPPYPTFVEMINFIMKHRRVIVDHKGANGHWLPAIEWCDVCQNNYDIIIQLEEEPDELVYLLKKLNMSEYTDTFLSKHNTSGEKSASEQEIRDYVKLLNREQIDFLNKMYARDFEVLGYDPITVKDDLNP